MKKILNYMKKNVLISVLLIIFILIIILGIIAIKVLIFPSYKDSKYGDRLEGIENVNITENRVNEVKTSIEENEKINYKSYRISGRIMNLYFNANEEINNDDIKKYVNEFVNKFNEQELTFYDFQVFVTKNEECILIGYKNKKSSGLSWNYVGE